VKKRFTEKHIIGFLREAYAGFPIEELSRPTASSRPPTTWRRKFEGMSVPIARLLTM